MKRIQSMKMHLADYFSWLRDETWHKQRQEEMIARFPRLGARQETLIETIKLDEQFQGRIYEATLHDGNVGYVIEIYEPLAHLSEGLTTPDTYQNDVTPVAQGYPDMQLYSSIEDARAAIPEALQKAIAQKNSTFTFTDKYGQIQTWLGYLPLEQKEDR